MCQRLICFSSLFEQTPLNPGRALTRMMHLPTSPCFADLVPLAGGHARDLRKVGTSVARSCLSRTQGLWRWLVVTVDSGKQNEDTLTVPDLQRHLIMWSRKKYLLPNISISYYYTYLIRESSGINYTDTDVLHVLSDVSDQGRCSKNC